MSWFGKKKTEAAPADAKQLPAPERLQQFMLAMDDAAKAISTRARYMRTSNFSLGEAGAPHTEYLEAIYIPAEERWKVQKVVLHEMLLPSSGFDKTSAVSSIFPEAGNLRYFEAIHRLAVFEQSQQTLKSPQGEKVQHHYKDIAHNDQIAFNIYGMPGRTVDGRPVGKDTYADDELALMQSLHGKRIAAAEAANKNTLPVKRVELPPPALQTNLGALPEIFAASAGKGNADTNRMVALIETQGVLHQIRRSIKHGFGVWTGGKLENIGAYGYHTNFSEKEFGKKYGDEGNDMNRWSLRGVAYAKYFRALKLAQSTAQQHGYAVSSYPDLNKIMEETAIATQSLLVMWLAQTTRQEWDGQYALNDSVNKKEVFGLPEEQGKSGTLTKEVKQLNWLLDRDVSALSRQEKEEIRKSIPNLLRPITVKEFAGPLNDLCGKLNTLEKHLRDYANQTIEHAIQPPEEVLALAAPEQAEPPGDMKSAEIGQLIPGRGVFIGTKILKDGQGDHVGVCDLFTTPYDLGRDEKGHGDSIVTTFNGAVKNISKIRNLFGHNGGKYASADELYSAIRSGKYNGEWFMPPLDVVKENLFAHKDQGVLKNTFRKDSAGISHWYWSGTQSPDKEAHVHSVRFSALGEDADHVDKFSLSCRPVRAELRR